ncbi:hypothetical protein O181_117869 [Austropuccinia psidii MF-1]|uniref:Uncharacterized protein n=1 Tax=Austropuccinia psidii MF-1 TaxID=1389203 RepID=A0A9Q3KE52_9BASI|nr:hypothetical protein [Austropuccinia psidii MF-1]
MFPQINQGVMNYWNILKKLLKEEEIVKYSNGWDQLSSKPKIKKDKGVPCQKEGEKQGRSPSSSYQKASPRVEEEQEKKLEETILPKLQDPKNPKECHGKCFQNGQNLNGIQGKRGRKNVETPFTKEITLSPDVVSNLTEIKNSILPFKVVKNCEP